MIDRFLFILFFVWCIAFTVGAHGGYPVDVEEDTLVSSGEALPVNDSIDSALQNVSKRKRKKLIRGYVGSQIEEFNNIDTAYIIPNLYDFTFMLQNTSTQESFSVKEKGGKEQSLSFAPNPTFRLGGYFGWRWIFLGYTFDVGGLLGNKKSNTKKTEMDLSLYTSKVGIDIYYRKTGNDFRVRNLGDLFSKDDSRPEGLSDDFKGLNIQTRGLNVYYIFNHRHFSYPAAFSQSTVQRRSCGTFKIGLSYSHHKIDFDHTQFAPAVQERLDDALLFHNVKYDDYNIGFGYSYNWVFKPRFLLCLSLMPALAYTHTYYDIDEDSGDGDSFSEEKRRSKFSFDNLNVDFVGRLGFVYNDSKYFAGMSLVAHSFDYRRDRFSLNNSFGSLNFYVGFYFKRKKGIDVDAWRKK